MKKIIALIVFLLLFLSTNVYAINLENAFTIKAGNIIGDIQDNTTVEEIKALINFEGDISKNGKPVSNKEIISTGMTYKTSNGKTYSLAVKGDSSGDGKVSGTDLMQAKNFIIENEIPSEVEKAALSSNSNLEISSTDILMIKKYIVEKIESLITAKDLYLSDTSINADLSQLPSQLKIDATTIPATAVQNIVYESSDRSVAEISSTGSITVKANGNAKLTIRDTINNFSKTCNIEVHTSPTRIFFDKSQIKLKGNDSTYQLSPRLEPSNSDIKNRITYTSSDTSTAVADNSGLITILKRGNFIITATTENGLSSNVEFSPAGFSIEGIPGQVANFFYEKGVPLVGIAALMGNAQIESGFNPAAKNEYNCVGLFQFNLNYDKLEEFAQNRGKPWTDAETQLEFLWDQLQNAVPGKNYSKAFDAIMHRTNPSDLEYVTWAWARYYEMPWTGDTSWEGEGRQKAKPRYNAAQTWYDRLVQEY